MVKLVGVVCRLGEVRRVRVLKTLHIGQTT